MFLMSLAASWFLEAPKEQTLNWYCPYLTVVKEVSVQKPRTDQPLHFVTAHFYPACAGDRLTYTDLLRELDRHAPQSNVHQQSSPLQEQALKPPNVKVKFTWLACPNSSALLGHVSAFVWSQGLAYIAHTGLKLTVWPKLCDFPASASWVQGTQVWAHIQQKQQCIS